MFLMLSHLFFIIFAFGEPDERHADVCGLVLSDNLVLFEQVPFFVTNVLEFHSRVKLRRLNPGLPDINAMYDV